MKKNCYVLPSKQRGQFHYDDQALELYDGDSSIFDETSRIKNNLYVKPSNSDQNNRCDGQYGSTRKRKKQPESGQYVGMPNELKKEIH